MKRTMFKVVIGISALLVIAGIVIAVRGVWFMFSEKEYVIGIMMVLGGILVAIVNTQNIKVLIGFLKNDRKHDRYEKK